MVRGARKAKLDFSGIHHCDFPDARVLLLHKFSLN